MVLGTKGGRPRDTLIQDAGAVKQALDNAIAVTERRNGRLIDAASLKRANTPRTHCATPGRRTISAGIWRRDSAKKKRWRWWQWTWGMATGAVAG